MGPLEASAYGGNTPPQMVEIKGKETAWRRAASSCNAFVIDTLLSFIIIAIASVFCPCVKWQWLTGLQIYGYCWQYINPTFVTSYSAAATKTPKFLLAVISQCLRLYLVQCCCTNDSESQRLRCNVVALHHTCWTETTAKTALLEWINRRTYSLHVVDLYCSCWSRYNHFINTKIYWWCIAQLLAVWQAFSDYYNVCITEVSFNSFPTTRVNFCASC